MNWSEWVLALAGVLLIGLGLFIGWVWAWDEYQTNHKLWDDQSYRKGRQQGCEDRQHVLIDDARWFTEDPAMFNALQAIGKGQSLAEIRDDWRKARQLYLDSYHVSKLAQQARNDCWVDLIHTLDKGGQNTGPIGPRPPAPPPIPPAEPAKFYLQNRTAGYEGNLPLWWAQGDQGYTSNLAEAQQFTTEEALRTIRGCQGTHNLVAWPVAEVNKLVYATVDSQSLYKIKCLEDPRIAGQEPGGDAAAEAGVTQA